MKKLFISLSLIFATIMGYSLAFVLLKSKTRQDNSTNIETIVNLIIEQLKKETGVFHGISYNNTQITVYINQYVPRQKVVSIVEGIKKDLPKDRSFTIRVETVKDKLKFLIAFRKSISKEISNFLKINEKETLIDLNNFEELGALNEP